MYAIEINNLWVKFRQEEDFIIRNLSLTVNEGEFIVLMGPSGCGKTTLCYCLNGIIPNLIKAELKGNITIFGKTPSEVGTSKMARDVGLVFQNPDMQLVTTSVKEEISFPLENFGLSEDEIRARVDEILDLTNLRGLEDRAPSTLSGGQKQALAIASVLALRPKLLVLDEPTSQLDPAGTKRITDLIVKLKDELKITIVAVEHRVEWAAEYADRILIMKDGKIVMEGKPSEIFSKRVNYKEIGFRVPQVTEMAYMLSDRGLNITPIPITTKQALSSLLRLIKNVSQ